MNFKKISPEDRKVLEYWEEYVDNMNRASPIPVGETPREQEQRIARLEKNKLEWFKFYFSKFCKSPFAGFHKKAIKRLTENMEWYEVLAWSRELAKSTIVMMVMLYLVLTGKKKNVILASANYDAAVDLLTPYKTILEKNQRLIHDYGRQQGVKDWSDGHFVTKKGASFRAFGALGKPRGTKKDEIRPDALIFDDFDTDEDCANPDMVDKKWNKVERAFFATRSISEELLIIFCGNIIAEYCCIKKAIEKADHSDIINIRDKNGRSSWPEKNTEAMIDRVRKTMSYASFEGEYNNNPITEGKIFKKLHFKKMKPLSHYSFLVAYTDPSYKSSEKNDYKATALVGKSGDEYHVLKMYCAQTTTATMLDWQYEIIKYVNGKTPVYYMIEWPSIDDTLKREIKKGNIRHKVTLPLMPDDDRGDKGNKFRRIESLLQPLNRDEKLWFNIDLKPSDMMMDAVDQFKALSPKSRAHDDAPDAVEGAVFNINSRTINDVSKVESIKIDLTQQNEMRI